MRFFKKDRRMITFLWWWAGLTLLSLLVFRSFPVLTESIYSAGLYPLITRALTAIWGRIPFSVTEILLIAVCVCAVVEMVQLLRGRLKAGAFFKTAFVSGVILFCWFYWAWGFNYYRMPLVDRLGLREVNVDSTTVAFWLQNEIDEINAAYVAMDSVNKAVVDAEIEAGYQRAAALLQLRFPGGVRPGKELLLNGILDKTLTSGVFSPFLHEVHVNAELLPMEYPFVLAHEKAHQMGIANEAEANFLAYVVCTSSADSVVNYSGRLAVLRRMLGRARALARYDTLRVQIRPEVIADFGKIRKRWQPHVGTVSRVSGTLYDSYLKANKIPEGRRNYSGVVELVCRWKEKQQSGAGPQP